MLLVATAIFVYYTIWTFVLPFISEENIIQAFSLPREYAIKIPAFLLIVGVTLVGAFVSSVLIKSTQKKTKSKKQNWIAVTLGNEDDGRIDIKLDYQSYIEIGKWYDFRVG